MSEIYYDVTPLMETKITGVGVYTKELFKELIKLEKSIQPVFKSSRLFKKKSIEQHIGIKGYPFFPTFFRSGIFHGTDFKLLTSSKHIGKVLTIHDLGIYRDDLLDQNFCKEGQKKLEHELGKNPEAIIVPTQFIRAEVEKRFPQFHGKVHVIHHGSDHIQYVDEKIERPMERDYFLYVGRLEKRKNVVGLIKAFNLFCENNSKVNLVIVGNDGFAAHEIHKEIKESPYCDRIHRMGYISDKELQGLYQNALAFVYPSLYEGFGIPLVESMKMGVPSLSSNFGAMKEVCAQGAHLVNVLDTFEFSQALEKFCSDSNWRGRWKALGPQRAEEFQWKKSAKLTYQVYQEVLAN